MFQTSCLPNPGPILNLNPHPVLFWMVEFIMAVANISISGLALPGPYPHTQPNPTLTLSLTVSLALTPTLISFEGPILNLTLTRTLGRNCRAYPNPHPGPDSPVLYPNPHPGPDSNLIAGAVCTWYWSKPGDLKVTQP